MKYYFDRALETSAFHLFLKPMISNLGFCMCGRFLLRCPPENWPENLFGDGGGLVSSKLGDAFRPRQNICPTQPVFAIVQAANHDQSTPSLRTLTMLRWGLVPSWASDRKIGASMINARSETVAEKPSFRTAFARRRCLIPADGYYEWVSLEKGKQPMLIERPNQELFCFAGLWERNEKLPAEKDGVADRARPLLTCTIITTAANTSLSAIHARMPVVVRPENYDVWLDPSVQNVSALQQLLVAAADGYFGAVPVERVSGE